MIEPATPVVCAERPLVMGLLAGLLSEAQSNRAIEHMRNCPPCHEALAAAATSTGAGRLREGMDLSDPDLTSLLASARSRFRPRHLRPAPRASWAFAALALVLAGVAVFRGPGRGREADEGAAEGRIWFQSLIRGVPVMLSPSGVAEARPRTFSCLLPPAATGFRLVVIGDDGSPVADVPFAPGAPDVLLEPVDIAGSEGGCRAQHVVAPFPADVAIEPGRTYGLAIALPGAVISPTITFTVAAGR